MRGVAYVVVVVALWAVTAVQLVRPPPHAPYLRDGKDLSSQKCEPTSSIRRAREREHHGDHSATKVRCPRQQGASDHGQAMWRFEGGGRGPGPGWGDWARVDGGALSWCAAGGEGTGTAATLLVGRVPRDPPRLIDFASLREVRSVLPPEGVESVELMVIPSGLALLVQGDLPTSVVLLGSDLTQRARREVKSWPRSFRTHLVSDDDQGLVIAVEQTEWLGAPAETGRWRLVQLTHSLVPTGRSVDVRAWSSFGWFGQYEGLWTAVDWVGWNRRDFPPCIMSSAEEWFVPGSGLRPWLPSLGERVVARGGYFNWMLWAVALLSALLAARVVRAGRLARALRRARPGVNLWEGRASPVVDGSPSALLRLADDETVRVDAARARRVGFAADEAIDGPCVVLGERTGATGGAYRSEPIEIRSGAPHVVFRGSLADARAQAAAIHEAGLRRALRTGFLLNLVALLVMLAYLNRG